MRVRLTQKFVDEAEVRNEDIANNSGRTLYWDEALPGFGLVVTAAGHRSYLVKYRVDGQPRKMTIKAALKLADARKEAKAIQGRVAKGDDPLTERRKAQASVACAELDTLQAICENFLVREGGAKRDARGNLTFDGDARALRTGAERYRAFKMLVFPTLGKRDINTIKNSELNKLLDDIEDNNGPVMAIRTRAYLQRVFRWHADGSDDYRAPSMRARGKANERDRILGEDEVRSFWRASVSLDHPFSHMLRFILLTATRRDEAADMRWTELEEDEGGAGDIWLIPAARYKTKVNFEIPLSKAAQVVLREAGRIKLGTAGYVFTTNGDAPISGFSKWKAHFDGLMLAERRKIAAAYGDDADKVVVPRWTIHDLRRTARSLMSQAGVVPDHAERALGHVIGGVRGVYDRHAYREEKRQAFAALAARVDHILRTVKC
jgi:integrase